ncbi:MAG TPA: hypothetical protein VLE46_14185 [Nitrospira sp.]|nr:hypothetical protein [Nitrospira sp.]
MKKAEAIKEVIRVEYGQAVREATNGKASCCGSGNLLARDKLDPMITNLYNAEPL